MYINDHNSNWVDLRLSILQNHIYIKFNLIALPVPEKEAVSGLMAKLIDKYRIE